MFSLIHQQSENVLELKHSDASFYAKIYLAQGASLQELILHNTPIIVDLEPLRYKQTYASAILFPFANRIKDGVYSYKNSSYELQVNNEMENNALHGLVYNKPFRVVEKSVSDNAVFVRLEYQENQLNKGFPFTYKLHINYTFTKDSVALNVIVENTSDKPFPFTLGWHPYFLSDDLYKSNLEFYSDKKIILDERNIMQGIEKIPVFKILSIKDKQLDDCWVLNQQAVKFITPDYQIYLKSSEEDCFLQVYTPPKKNIIAIEPTTGVSDSFNNKIGLKELNPQETYSIQWDLKIVE